MIPFSFSQPEEKRKKKRRNNSIYKENGLHSGDQHRLWGQEFIAEEADVGSRTKKYLLLRDIF